MKKTDWLRAKDRLKEVFDEGLALLKEGAQEARYVTSRATHVVGLELDIVKVKNRLHKIYMNIGRDVTQLINRLKPISQNKKIAEMARLAARLEKMIRGKEYEMQHVTVVRKKSATRRKPAKKKKAPVRKGKGATRKRSPGKRK